MFTIKISEINDKENIIMTKSFETEQQMNKFLFELKGISLEYDVVKELNKQLCLEEKET